MVKKRFSPQYHIVNIAHQLNRNAISNKIHLEGEIEKIANILHKT